MPDDNKKTADAAAETTAEAIETASTDEQATDSHQNTAPKRKRRAGPWLFLLFIFIGLPAAWLFTPSETRQLAMDTLSQFTSATQHPANLEPAADMAANEQPVQADEPETPEIITLAVPESAPTALPAEAPATHQQTSNQQANNQQTAVSPAPSATQTDALIDEMQQLRNDLSAMQQTQIALQHQLQARQQLELRAWLRWIAQKETHLQQRAALWDDIATLPLLNDAQRQIATDLAALSRTDLLQINNWQAALTRLAEQLPVARQTDILPKPDNDRFAWLSDAFHLRPAPGDAEKQRAALRLRMQDMQHALAIENWPQPRVWRRFLGALRDQFGDDTDLGLPENLRDIRQHIEEQRGLAADWLENL